jgi:hypothetical protein
MEKTEFLQLIKRCYNVSAFEMNVAKCVHKEYALLSPAEMQLSLHMGVICERLSFLLFLSHFPIWDGFARYLFVFSCKRIPNLDTLFAVICCFTAFKQK